MYFYLHVSIVWFLPFFCKLLFYILNANFLFFETCFSFTVSSYFQFFLLDPIHKRNHTVGSFSWIFTSSSFYSPITAKNPLALTGKRVSPLDIKVIRISLHLWTLRVLIKLHIYFCIQSYCHHCRITNPRMTAIVRKYHLTKYLPKEVSARFNRCS